MPLPAKHFIVCAHYIRSVIDYVGVIYLDLTHTSAAALALFAGLGTWLITALGAAAVFLYKRSRPKNLKLLLGFAAGIMLSSSFWSLLMPALDEAEALGLPFPALPLCAGFALGALFIWAAEKLARRSGCLAGAGSSSCRAMMLALSVTLHNIPEGLAIGLAFGAVGAGVPGASVMSAFSVALGIGLQNYPEGAAVSIPLYCDGQTRLKSFMYGQLSGVVEPIAALLGALVVHWTQRLLPWSLAFAAGAMFFVSVHELIPEACERSERAPYLAAGCVTAGFAIMMMAARFA